MIKENIISNYYIKHQKVKEISEELGVSTAYITKIIKQDTRYSNEKQYRKERSKSKRKIDQNKFIKHKREKTRRQPLASIRSRAIHPRVYWNI